MNPIFTILLAFLCFNPIADQAQKAYQKNKVQQNPKYNPETVITIDAEIISVNEIKHEHGNSAGIHLEVKSTSGLQVVHLGPNWYVNEQAVQLKTGDKVTITGSKVTMDDKPVLIAKEIKKGSEKFQLRSENGTPLWSGQGKKKK